MTITPIGFLQYQVVGQEGTYTVCLEDNRCDCPHWRCKLSVKLRDNLIDKLNADCKHIERVKIYAWNEVQPLLVKHRNTK